MVESSSKIINYELCKSQNISLLHNFQFNKGSTQLHGWLFVRIYLRIEAIIPALLEPGYCHWTRASN